MAKLNFVLYLKGPPNAQKNLLPLLTDAESSYELLLKQQQLFLQWQLEWQQKYPHILPAAQVCDRDGQLSTVYRSLLSQKVPDQAAQGSNQQQAIVSLQTRSSPPPTSLPTRSQTPDHVVQAK